MTDFVQYLARQVAVSRCNFGPDERTHSVIDHIKKELVEIAGPTKPTELEGAVAEFLDFADMPLINHDATPALNDMKRLTKARMDLEYEQSMAAPTTPNARANEWVDVVILALDGLTRAVRANFENPPTMSPMVPHTPTADEVAREAVYRILAKQHGKNELRDWPDWRTADPNKAIEHVRGKHD